MKEKEKRKRGRPVVRKMPDKIDDTPENIAKAMFRVGKKREGEWRYQKREKA